MMKEVLVIALSACLCVGLVSAVIYDLDDDEYYQMPPVVALDPYTRCLRQPGGVYCSAYFTYVADQPTPLLHMMQEYSEQYRTHYNHTRAFLGTCVTLRCKHLLNNTLDLGLVLEACLNETFLEKYKLKVRLDDVTTCISKDESKISNKIPIDNFDIAVGIIVMSFVVLNIVGSFVDVESAEESKNVVVSRFLICFSMTRNWKKLTSPSQIQDPRIESLKGLHGIRALSTTLVVTAHALLPVLILAKNPQFLEESYSMPLIHILLNGTLIMQTFLIMSGFLLIYNLQIMAEKNILTWRLISGAIFKRLIRLTPAYALILAVTATLLRHVGSGPLWEKIVIQESNDCRKDWWMNLLYINNLIDGSHCTPQTWYLGTDTQLYIVGLTVFLLGRDLEVRKKILGGLFLLGLVLPGLHTYFQDLEGNLLITPRTVIDFFVTDDTFNKIYRRGHTNLSGYVIGLTLGYLFYHLQKTGFEAAKHKKWHPIYNWLLLPLALVIVMSNMVFYGPRLGVGYRVLASMFHRPLFAACIAAILLGFFLKIEKLQRSVVEWGGWVPLSRVSYSAYLLHVTFIRTCAGLYTDTFHVSYLRVMEMVTWMLVLTWISATLFWLTVEAPLGHLTKLLLEPSKLDAKKES